MKMRTLPQMIAQEPKYCFQLQGMRDTGLTAQNFYTNMAQTINAPVILFQMQDVHK